MAKTKVYKIVAILSPKKFDVFSEEIEVTIDGNIAKSDTLHVTRSGKVYVQAPLKILCYEEDNFLLRETFILCRNKADVEGMKDDARTFLSHIHRFTDSQVGVLVKNVVSRAKFYKMSELVFHFEKAKSLRLFNQFLK